MRCATGLFALSVLAGSLALPAPAAADHDVSIFYEELSPYGDWVYSERYGWVWTPYDVPPGWRPYMYGRWEYTDHGWTWVSDEEFGWATYHYGRWYRDPYYGWAWVPGTEWGPAWVAWREGDQYVGWAPLPPEAEWQADFGLRIGNFDLNVSLGSDAWTFVEHRRIIEPHIHRHVVLPSRNVTILRQAPVVTRYRYVDGRIVNYGIPVERVERVVGRRVYRTPVHVVDTSPRLYRSRGTTVRYHDGGVNIYRPRITRSTTTIDPRVYRTRDADGVRIERRGVDGDGTTYRRRIEGPGPDVRQQRDVHDDARRTRQMRERDEDRRRDADRQNDNRRDVERRREAQERSRDDERSRREAQERSRADEKRKVKKSKPDDDRD